MFGTKPDEVGEIQNIQFGNEQNVKTIIKAFLWKVLSTQYYH